MFGLDYDNIFYMEIHVNTKRHDCVRHVLLETKPRVECEPYAIVSKSRPAMTTPLYIYIYIHIYIYMYVYMAIYI